VHQIRYLRRTTNAAAGNGLGTTIKYLCGAAVIGLSTMAKHLRRTTRQRHGHYDQVPANAWSGIGKDFQGAGGQIGAMPVGLWDCRKGCNERVLRPAREGSDLSPTGSAGHVHSVDSRALVDFRS
jgi:hypothetical protein